MPNVFNDQSAFMRAGDQTVGEHNESQFKLYVNLIDEEVGELHEAVEKNDRVAQLDGLTDILVVTVGAMHSLGCDPEGAWKEVMRSNFSKVDKDTGKIRKREDGKILKPLTYSPPNLEPFVNKE